MRSNKLKRITKKKKKKNRTKNIQTKYLDTIYKPTKLTEQGILTEQWVTKSIWAVAGRVLLR